MNIYAFFVDSSGRLVVNGLIKINNIENGEELNLVVDRIKNTQYRIIERDHYSRLTRGQWRLQL